MPTAIIDGITTRYEMVGSGPPLLMYAPAGFDASLDKWSTQGIYAKIKPLEHLSKTYSCIVFDRRECGGSGGRVERVTWAHYVAQGKGLLDHLNIKRAHLMGGCMGCCPVMAFAAAHPDVTLSMVLFWPVGGAKYRLTSHQRRFAVHQKPLCKVTDWSASWNWRRRREKGFLARIHTRRALGLGHPAGPRLCRIPMRGRMSRSTS